MVRNAIADESFLTYITGLAKPDTCTVGLILGQPTPTKDYVIHLAKTPPYQGENNSKKVCAKPVKNINEILETWVADHAKHATRMLPGGMYVLGIFIISQEDVLTPFSPKVKSIVTQIHKQLATNPFLYGNSDYPEKLILNYCMKTKSYTCKSFEAITAIVKPADFKFQQKLATKWLQLECKYELDQLFPIPEKQADWPLKKHMTTILTSINENLKSGVFMFDDEIKDGDEILEGIGKKKKVPRSKIGHCDNGDAKAMQVSIILPCDCKDLGEPIELRNCGGHIKMSGHVACKLWLCPKATVVNASQAVIQDLVRSLAARLEMHWDSLIEEEHGSPEDTNSIHEPPRRVLVTLPASKITLSDYLFPGEGPQEAQISLQELLDITVTEKDAIKDIEGQADLTELYNDGLEADSDDTLPKMADTNKFIYIVGLGVAFFVLIMSLVIHYFKLYY